jgi:hypothetical protein
MKTPESWSEPTNIPSAKLPSACQTTRIDAEIDAVNAGALARASAVECAAEGKERNGYRSQLIRFQEPPE